MPHTPEGGPAVLAVMVFVFDDHKNLLLLKRRDNGCWEPVKGGMLAGEHWCTAARRELQEETGLSPGATPTLVATVNDVLDTSEGKRTVIKGHAVCCLVAGTTPAPDLAVTEEREHTAFKWVNYERIRDERLFPPTANMLVKKIVKQREVAEAIRLLRKD